MTEKQRKFADEYLAEPDAARAAAKAGYDKKAASKSGARNLKNPKVWAYIEERLSEAAPERIATTEEILEYLTSILRGQNKELSAKDGMKAAELLGKRYGIFSDKQESSGTVIIYGEGEIRE